MAHGDERKAMLPLDWVAERLHMGTRSTVSQTAALVKRKLESDGKLSKVLKKTERITKL